MLFSCFCCCYSFFVNVLLLLQSGKAVFRRNNTCDINWCYKLLMISFHSLAGKLRTERDICLNGIRSSHFLISDFVLIIQIRCVFHGGVGGLMAPLMFEKVS